jgi:hypothetical protein
MQIVIPLYYSERLGSSNSTNRKTLQNMSQSNTSAHEEYNDINVIHKNVINIVVNINAT